ncbi:hypothetical protein JCM8097_005150 [Rhodosporidiobolus ruineniae]
MEHSSYVRASASREGTPPSPHLVPVGGSTASSASTALYSGRSRSRVVWWGVTSAAWTLVISYIGRRTTASTLLLFPFAHFVVLTIITRLAALASARLRAQVGLGWGSCLGLEGAREGRARVGVLLVVVAVGETLAVGGLELGVVLAMQTLLAPLILLLSPHFPLPTPSSLSSHGLAVFLPPLLLGLVSSTAVPPFLPFLAGAVGVTAQAMLWCTLTRSWSEGPAGTFATLWHAAPLATALTGLLAGLNLLLHLPLPTSLFPPPSFLFFLLLSSLLHFASLDLALAVFYEAGEDVLSVAGAVVPRGWVVLLAAGLGGASLRREGMYHAAFAIASAVVGWPALSSTGGGMGESSPYTSGGKANSGYETPPRRRFSIPPGGSPAQAFPETWSPRSTSPPPSSPRSTLVGSPPTRRGSASSSSTGAGLSRFTGLSFLALLPFLPFFLVLVQSIHPLPCLPVLPVDRLPPYLSDRLGLFTPSSPSSSLLSKAAFTPPTLDIVFAYFNQSLPAFEEHVRHVKGRGTVGRYRTRVTVYSKGGAGREELERVEGVDEVVELPNLGREGGTYLHHLIRRFDPPGPGDTFSTPGAKTSHADMTLFLQHHLAWPWIADQRFDHLEARTGFLSLGPYVKSDCGRDLRVGARWERMRDVYSMFREDFCPPTLQLSTWSAQFFVSRRRILQNSVSKYKRLLELLQAPEEHWIYNEGMNFEWNGPMGPAAPFLGHALERSWPVIFNCTDPKLADRCPDEVYDKGCQCMDEWE